MTLEGEHRQIPLERKMRFLLPLVALAHFGFDVALARPHFELPRFKFNLKFGLISMIYNILIV